jgi:hypothetical protein
MKETKGSLIETMRGMLETASKSVKEILSYTINAYDKDAKSVTLQDIKDTIADVTEMLLPQTVIPMENQLKIVKKVDKVEEKKVVKTKLSEAEGKAKLEAILEEKKPLAEEEVAITSVKKDTKKKKVTPPPQEDPSLKKLDMLVTLPDTLDTKVGKLKVRRDIKNIKEVHALMNDDVDIVICMYWNKRQLRQFPYDPLGILKVVPTSFTDDLDIIDLLYASEEGLQLLGVSIYTEVPMVILPQGFETDEDGLRYANGAEFQIYEVVSEEGQEDEVVEDEEDEEIEEIELDTPPIPQSKVVKTVQIPDKKKIGKKK